MRIDRSHVSWMFLVAVVTLVSGVLYMANFYPEMVPFGFRLPSVLGEAPPLRNTRGGTPLGLIFGGVSFLIFVFAAALGMRKKKRLLPIGSVQFWLKAHIWLTLLTLPLVAFHSGFKLGGLHTTLLMVLYAIVMGSGIFGIILQQFMPGLMRESLPREVVFEQIPYLKTRLLENAVNLRKPVAEALALGGAGDISPQVLCKFLDEECIPYLSAKSTHGHALGKANSAADVFRNIRVNISPEWRPRLAMLETWCEERRLMDLQTKYHHWLHGWLLIHVPVSIALLLFTAWHACVGLIYLMSVSR